MAHAEATRVVARADTPIARPGDVDIRPELDIRQRRASSLVEKDGSDPLMGR